MRIYLCQKWCPIGRKHDEWKLLPELFFVSLSLVLGEELGKVQRRSHVTVPSCRMSTYPIYNPPTHPLARRSLLKCQCLLLRSWLGRVRSIMVNTSHEHFTSCAHCVNCNCCCGCFGCIFSQKCVFFRLPAVTCCCEWVILPAAPPWQLTSWCSCFPFAFNNAQLVLV